jgi:hypothetical protein
VSSPAEPERPEQRRFRRRLAVISIVLAVLLVAVGILIITTKEQWAGGIMPVVLGAGLLIYWSVSWSSLKRRNLI